MLRPTKVELHRNQKYFTRTPLFSISLSLSLSPSVIFSLSLSLYHLFSVSRLAKFFQIFLCILLWVCWYNTIVCSFVHKIVWLCVQLCVRLCTKLCDCVYTKDGPCQIPRLILMLSSWALSVSWPHPLRFYQLDSWSLFIVIFNIRLS